MTALVAVWLGFLTAATVMVFIAVWRSWPGADAKHRQGKHR